MSRYRTPLLVPTHQKFDFYLKRLSKPAKKNYKKAQKLNADKQFVMIPFDRDLVMQFMYLWTLQEVEGENPVWTVGIEYFEDREKAGKLVSFGAIKDGEIYGIQMLEVYGDYAYAPTPMYEKRWNKEYLPTWLWFNSIKYLCNETRVRNFDLGGGLAGTWPNIIRHKEHPDIANLWYKWRYVPVDIKENPNGQPEYKAFDCDCLAKSLVLSERGCKWCGKQL